MVFSWDNSLYIFDEPQLICSYLTKIGRGHESMLRCIWLALFIMVHFSAAGSVFAAERPVVRDVAVYAEGGGARIEIRADGPLAYKSYLMPELAKWVIDLPGATTARSDDESKRMRTLPLERVSVRQKEVNGELFTRIGLDFTGEVELTVKADQRDKGLLVFLMKPSGPAAQKPAAAHPRTAVAGHSPGTEAPAASGAQPASVLPASAAGAKNVTAVRITAAAIRIEGDGRMAVPVPLTLKKPGRLVLDLPGIGSGLETVPVPANSFGIVRARLGKNSGTLRLVFEVRGDIFPDFRMQETVNGMEIIPVPAVPLQPVPGSVS